MNPRSFIGELIQIGGLKLGFYIGLEKYRLDNEYIFIVTIFLCQKHNYIPYSLWDVIFEDMAFKYTCVYVTLNISSKYIVVGALFKFSSAQSYMSTWLLYAMYIFMTSVSPSVCWCICYPPLDVYHTDYQWFTGKYNNLTQTYISQRGGQLLLD